MSLDTPSADNVRVGVTGAIYIDFSADKSAPKPTSADSALGAGWTGLGYVSEDGVTFARDVSTETINAWQGSNVRTLVTEASETAQFTLIETNVNTVRTYFGSVVDTETGKVSVNPKNTGGAHPMIIDVIDGNSRIRHVIDSCEVSAWGDQTVANSSAVGYDVTFSLYETADASGNRRTRDTYYSSLVATPETQTQPTTTDTEGTEGNDEEIA
jgi:hypothetical protein